MKQNTGHTFRLKFDAVYNNTNSVTLTASDVWIKVLCGLMYINVFYLS